MKRLTCELCGSIDLIKQDGAFVCRSCGMKYTLEEAKKLMAEAEGMAPATDSASAQVSQQAVSQESAQAPVQVPVSVPTPVTTAPAVAPVQNDHSGLIDRYMQMAQNALRGDNRMEAELYCNKILELDSLNARAWLYKGSATAWQSTFAHLRIREAVNCWHTALSNCTEEEKAEFYAYTDDQMTHLTVALCDLSAGFLNSGMNVHRKDAYLKNFHNIIECLRLYTTNIHVVYKWNRAINQGAMIAAPHFVKSATATKDQFHRLKPTHVESRQEYLLEMQMCLDLADRLARSVPGAKAKATCYQACVDILNIMDGIGSYHWFDGQTIYKDDIARKHYYSAEIAEYRKKVTEEQAKVAEEKQKEYWEDHPDEYKEHQRKQEEERKRKEQAEKDKREAMSNFWAAHSKERFAIQQEIKQLETKKRELIANNSGVKQVELIDQRCEKLQAILNADRQLNHAFSPNELKTIEGQAEFTAQLEKKAKYDAYLNTYPLLKEKDVLAANKEQLKKQLNANDGPGPVFVLFLLIGFVAIGGLIIWSGVAMETDILSFLGGILVFLGAICTIGYGIALIKAANKKSAVKAEIAVIERKEKLIAAIPAYTEEFDPATAKAVIEQENQKTTRKRKWTIGLIVSAVMAVIAFLIFWATYLSPLDTYNTALEQLDRGNVIGAYETLVALDGFKDSEEIAESIYVEYRIEQMKGASVGEYVYFGSYEQDNNKDNGAEAIYWRVLAIEGDRVLLISDCALDSKRYHETDEPVTWETCDLRQWLNTEFLHSAFSKEEKAFIPTVTVTPDPNPDTRYETEQGNETLDQVFLLSMAEAERYLNDQTACRNTKYASTQGWQDGSCSWWLRTMGEDSTCASYVNQGGGLCSWGQSVRSTWCDIRPAIWVYLGSQE